MDEVDAEEVEDCYFVGKFHVANAIESDVDVDACCEFGKDSDGIREVVLKIGIDLNLGSREVCVQEMFGEELYGFSLCSHGVVWKRSGGSDVDALCRVYIGG